MTGISGRRVRLLTVAVGVAAAVLAVSAPAHAQDVSINFGQGSTGANGLTGSASYYEVKFSDPSKPNGQIWAGVVGSYSDLIYNWRRTGPGVTPSPSSEGRGWRGQWLQQYGTPEENPVFWNAISANSYLADLSGPIQLHHGTADEDVPLEFSQTLYQQIRAAGKYAELYTYPGDNHNISASFDTAMSRSIEFYDQYLK